MLGKVLDQCETVCQGCFRTTNMKLIAYLIIALALGYALAVFLDPSFPDILEIIDNPKF